MNSHIRLCWHSNFGAQWLGDSLCKCQVHALSLFCATCSFDVFCVVTISQCGSFHFSCSLETGYEIWQLFLSSLLQGLLELVLRRTRQARDKCFLCFSDDQMSLEDYQRPKSQQILTEMFAEFVSIILVPIVVMILTNDPLSAWRLRLRLGAMPGKAWAGSSSSEHVGWLVVTLPLFQILIEVLVDCWCLVTEERVHKSVSKPCTIVCRKCA